MKRIKKWDCVEYLNTTPKGLSQAIETIIKSLCTSPTVLTITQAVNTTRGSQTERVTEKEKAFFRSTHFPSSVIIVTDILEKSNLKSIVNQWYDSQGAEVYIIAFREHSEIQVYTALDILDSYQLKATDNEKRKIANKWSKALGWQFSAPVYRDTWDLTTLSYGGKRWINRYRTDEDTDILTKYTHNPETFRQSKNVASDEEIKDFCLFFDELVKNNLLQQALEPDYYICPHCGNPIKWTTIQRLENQNTTCDYCDYELSNDNII